MGKQKPAEVIYPPNTLKVKVGGKLTGDHSEAVQRAEDALVELQGEMHNWLISDLERLTTSYDNYSKDLDSEDKRQEFYTCAHDLKGLGTTYNYPLVSRIAGTLCDLVTGFGVGNPPPSTLVNAHVAAIKVIIRDEITDPENPVGSVLAAELEQNVAAIVPPDATI